MIILDNANRSLELSLGAGVATTELSAVVSYADHTASTFTPINQITTSNGMTAVTIVSAPAASPVTQRQLKFLCIMNVDTASAILTIKYNDNATKQTLIVVTLQVNESLNYSETGGWYVVGTCGQTKPLNAENANGSFYAYQTQIGTVDGSTFFLPTSDSTYAEYAAHAIKAYTSATVTFKTTFAASTITWAEVAILKGNLVAAGNPTLTTIAFTDISTGIITLSEVHTVNIELSGITVGDQLWIAFGLQATNTGNYTRINLTGEVAPGFFVSAATTRPSTMGAGTSFTASTLSPFWWILKFQ